MIFFSQQSLRAIKQFAFIILVGMALFQIPFGYAQSTASKKADASGYGSAAQAIAQTSPTPPSTSSPKTVSFCEQWSQTDNAKNSKKVCTDLMEGIPLSVLKGTGNVCVTGAEKDDMCLAVISDTGFGAIESYIAMIYKYAGWVISLLAVLMIIISGFGITTGGLSPDGVNQAKKRIIQIVGGVTLYYLIGAILRGINPTFFK